MLPVLNKHFAMIKQKSDDERMEQSSLSIITLSIIKKAIVLSHWWKK